MFSCEATHFNSPPMRTTGDDIPLFSYCDKCFIAQEQICVLCDAS